MNIESLMDSCNNYFEKNYSILEVEFDVNNLTLEVLPNASFIKNRYIKIINSELNDGVYKIINIANKIITLDSELLTEKSKVYILFLSVPKLFIELFNDMKDFESKNPTNVMKSETIGEYSYTRQDVGDVYTAFKSKINIYRKMPPLNKFDFKNNISEVK